MASVKGDKTRVPSDSDLANAVKTERLICCDVDQNNNKYWNGYVLQNGDGYCVWGRVNKAPQHEYYAYGNISAATAWLDKKSYEKQHKSGGKESYTLQKTIAAGSCGVVKQSSSSGVVQGSSLKALAAQQIQSDPEAKKLVTWLADINVHQITKNTQITYNVATGSFSTPLGLVTPDGLSDARLILADIEDYVDAHDWENPKYKKLLSNYLRIVPQDLGMTRGWHTTFLAGSNALQKQASILDALEAALLPTGGTAAAQAGPVQSEQVFNVTLETVTDAAVIARITAKYNKEKGDHSDVRAYKPFKVWTIHINTVRSAYQKDGAKLDNNWELWHGTKASNLLSILKAGLIIPKSYANGWNYGQGVYFSDQSTKSIRYATGHISGDYSNIDRTFMLLANVGMGKYYIPKSGVSTGKSFYVPPGHDSTFAKGGESGVQNNEMIVYRTSQADLAYLIEFRK